MRTLRPRFSLRGPRIGRRVTRCAVLMASALALPHAEAGAPAQWAGGTGNWNDPIKWNPNVVPNNGGTTYDVTIGGAAHDVSLNLSATVDTVQNNGILRFLDGFTLTTALPGGLTNTGQLLVNHAGTSGLFGRVTNSGFLWAQSGVLQLNKDVTNQGTVWLGDGSVAGGTSGMTATASLNLSGGGELYFFSNAMTPAKQPALQVAAFSTLTNGPSHRIHGGFGRITGAGSLVNNGLIDADTPLRTLTIDTAEFLNAGNLWARSGNLIVNVADWRNTGVVRASAGSRSQFNGTQVTNDATGVIESVGGASLDISQNFTNRGAVSANASGVVNIVGNNRLVTNLPGGVMSANAGRLGFESSSGLIQNFGTIRANQGEVRFNNGMDIFGGNVAIADHSTLNVRNGNTTMTQTRTTLDATSTLAVTDRLTGVATLGYNGLLENTGGLLLAQSEAGGTATFNLSGLVRDTNGTIRSDGGVFNISNAEFEEAGQLALDIRNSGSVSFTNVSSTIGQMNVAWTGTGGSLTFNNYQAEVTPTTLNLAGWAADGGSFTVTGGTSLNAAGLPTLRGNATLTVSGAGSSLSMPNMTETAQGSLVDLVSGGWLTTSNLLAQGNVSFRAGTFDGNLTLDTTSALSIPNGVNTITGDFGWVGDRTVQIDAGSTSLNIGGATTIAPGSVMSLRGNSSRFSGSGAVTNNGLIEGGALNTSNSTFFDLKLTNTANGVVRAFPNGAATNTFLQFNNVITNAGMMEAGGANLYFAGADVTNSGTLRAVDHPSGSKLIFLNGARVTNAGGTTTIDGALSSLEVSGASVLNLGTLSFTNGGGGLISDNGTVVSATNAVTLGPASNLTVQNSSRFSPLSLDLRGQMFVRNSARVDAPILIRPDGRLTVDSSIAFLDGGVTVQNVGGNVGRISLVQNGAQIAGAGSVTNSGLIEGGAPNTGNSTYFDLALTNNASGVVRAFRNGTPTNTYFQIRGPVTNAGLMEANGANLYFSGATEANSGTLRAVETDVPSKLIFLGGTTVTNTNGLTQVNGPLSALEVSGAANLALGTLTFTNGAGGFISDNGTTVTATNTVAFGSASSFLVQNSGRFTAAGITLDGTLTLRGSGRVDAPITMGTSSRIVADSGQGILNGNVSVPRSGPNFGRISLVQNSAHLLGSGVVTNSGLIEGGAPNTGNSTFFDLALTNNPNGIVRAFQNGTPTNTFFQIRGSVTNSGMMEAVGGNLYYTGATVTNSGTMRAVNDPAGSKLIYLGGTRVTNVGGTTTLDGAASALEVSGAADVQLGTLSFTNGAGGFMSDGGTIVTATNNVPFSAASSFFIQNSSRFVAPGMTMNGQLTLRGSGRVDAPITMGTSARIIADSGQGIINGNVSVPRSGPNFGRISLVQNSAHLFGSGIVTNSGLIEGGSPNNSSSTFFDLSLVNNADGVVRAFRNGTPTNTFFQIRGNVTNNGMMEAVGANLYFWGATGQNGGTLRAVDDAAGSKLIFLNGTRITNAGGTTSIDGAQSALEVSAAANVGLGTLSFSNGGSGSVTGNGSVVTATNNVPVPIGSTLSVTSSGRFVASGMMLGGALTLQSNGVVDAPVTVTPTGRVTANSGAGFLNGDVSITNDGAGGIGLLRIVGNSASVGGTGRITNNGTIEGGAPSNNNTTFMGNELVNNASGLVRAFSNGGATNTTFQLSGNIVNRGLLRADAATLSLSGVFVDNLGGSWSAINGGRLLVSNSFVGGSSGSATTIDGDASRLEIVTNSLVGFDTLNLTNGGDVTVSGNNTTLAILSPFVVPPGSVAAVASSARLQADGVTVNGSLAAQGGTILSNVHLGATGRIDATSATTTIQGNVTTTASGSVISVTNSGTQLRVDGTVNNVGSATVQVNSNTTALAGGGLFTNGGLLEGGAFNNNNTVTVSKDLLNNGAVTARSFGGATGTTLQFNGARITNNGSMTASTANLTISGSTVDHAGTMRAQDGGVLTLQSRATVNNLGGGATVDGDASRFQVVSQSTAQLQSLALTNGGDVTLSGSTLQVSTPVSAGVNSVVTLDGAATFGAPSLLVNGLMNAGNATVTGPTTVGTTGQLAITSSATAAFNGALTIQNNGRLTLLGNSFRIGGAGSITNSGLIEGGANSTNNTTFIDKNITNNVGGVIRAIQNGSATGTFVQLNGTITNSGTMEANGGNLNFLGANVNNNGLIRAANHAAGSRLIFQSSAQVSNLGGSAEVNGANSRLEVSGAANVALGNLTFSNGGTGSVTGNNSRLSGNVTLNAGSTLSVTSNGRLQASSGGLTNGGTVTISSGSTFTSDGPVVNSVGGTLEFNAGASLNLLSSLTDNGTLNLASNPIGVAGDLSVGSGGKLSATPGATINLGGDFVNASTQRTQFASSSVAMNLNASNNAADPLRFEVGGQNLGPVVGGLTNNFGLLSMSMTGADEFVILVDDFDNPADGLATPDAVYVSSLTIVDPDSRLNLNGLDLYYGAFNGDAATILLSGGSFTQVPGLSLAPEPATALLLLVGFGFACRRGATRRRFRRELPIVDCRLSICADRSSIDNRRLTIGNRETVTRR